MDRDRYRTRAVNLRDCAQIVDNLTRMPDRATAKDFQQVVDLMSGAANDIDALVKAELPGCICRRIDYDYLDYVEGCCHHHVLYHRHKGLQANYDKMVRALKNEVRMRLVVAALSGTAAVQDLNDLNLVKRAIAIADETLRQIIEEAP